MQVAEHSAPSSLSKKKKKANLLAQEVTRPSAVRLQTLLHTGALRSCSHLLLSHRVRWSPGCATSVVSSSSVRATPCNPVKRTYVFRLRPNASGWHLPASSRPGLGYVSSAEVRVSTCVPCDQVGRRWFPKGGRVLTPGKGQTPGRQQNPWYCGIKAQMGLPAASIHLPTACVLL